VSAPSGTWDAAFELVPAGGDNLSVGDDGIRTLKTYISTRFGREHYGLSTDTNSQHGWPKRGHARTYFQDSAPTVKPETSGATLDTTAITICDGSDAAGHDPNMDDGRLWIDRTRYLPFVWGPDALASTTYAWHGLSHDWLRFSIQGTLTTGTNLLPPIVVPYAAQIMKVSARVGTAPTGASILLDINKNGGASYSIFSGFTRITIAAAGYANSVSYPSLHATYSLLAADDYLTVDIDQVGSTVVGANLSVTIDCVLVA
jgi:hypothetical protein